MSHLGDGVHAKSGLRTRNPSSYVFAGLSAEESSLPGDTLWSWKTGVSVRMEVFCGECGHEYGVELTGLGALNAGEPHGHMKLESSTTTTTTVFIFGAPTSPTTTTQSFTAAADVTCLTVVNNRAVLSGRVSRFSGNATPQRGLLFNATDNTIAGTQLLPDEWAGALVPEALQVCPLPGADAPITKGNILVEDN